MIDATGRACYVRSMRTRCCRILNFMLVGVALVALTGCGMDSARDQRDDRDPMMRRALARKNAGDFDGAIDAYQRLLDKKPQLAMAHLQLGILFDQNREDYVRAIYHYERYLEMRPESEKARLVREMADKARLAYAASLPDMPNEAINTIASLRSQISVLNSEVERLSAMRSPAPTPTATPVAVQNAAAAPMPSRSAPPPVVAPAAPTAASTYVVKSGDTLSKIAGKMYGDSKKWKPIYDANRSALPGGPQSVKVGQTLIIPAQ